MVEDLHRAAEPPVLGRLVDRHDRLDRVRVERLVEALAAAERAHRVEVEGHVDAGLLALGHQVVELVEARRRDLGVRRAAPDVVPLVLGDRDVDVVEADRVPAAHPEVLHGRLALLLGEEVRIEAEIAADEAERLAVRLLKGEVSVLADLRETVLARRGVPAVHGGEVEDRSGLDLVRERELHPLLARRDLRGRRREV